MDYSPGQLPEHPVDFILKGGIQERPRLFRAMTGDMIHVTA